jgi:hypothetical protein
MLMGNRTHVCTCVSAGDSQSTPLLTLTHVSATDAVNDTIESTEASSHSRLTRIRLFCVCVCECYVELSELRLY